MSSEQDRTLTERLCLVREMLGEGVRSGNDAFPLARMRAILTLEHAVELLLCTVLPVLNVTYKDGDRVPALLEQLVGRKGMLTAHLGPIRNLHALRNRVQHAGTIPSLEDLRQFRARAEVFIRDTLRAVFTKDLEQFSLASLVTHPEARRHLVRAEAALVDRDYDAVAAQAAVAVEVGMRPVKSRQSYRWRGLRTPGEPLLRFIGDAALQAAGNSDPALRRFASDLRTALVNRFWSYDAFDELLEPIELIRAGVDLEALARFRDITPVVHWTVASKEPHIAKPRRRSVSADEALFAFDFACTTLLHLQRVHGRESDLLPAGNTGSV